MVWNQASNVLLDDQAHLTPFLAKYLWSQFAKGIDPSTIAEWVSRPTSGDLSGLRDLVDQCISSIKRHMEVPKKWTIVLRWINTPKE